MSRVRLTSAIVAVALALGVGAADAQAPGRPLRLGVLETFTPVFDPKSRPTHRALVEGLEAQGWTPGRNLVVEFRSAAGRPEQLPAVAAELAALKPDVIVSIGPTTFAARDATSTIPIVMLGTQDPVFMGAISSLAHPGGNVTGLAVNANDLAIKRVQLLKEAVPQLARVAVLWNSSFKSMMHAFQLIEVAAPSLGVTLQSVRVAGSHEFDRAFAAIEHGRSGGLVVLFGPMTGNDVPRIVDFITRTRLPTIFEGIIGVDTGGLMALGADFPDMARRAAEFVRKLASGAKPADLPVEEPTKFDLVINLRTAKALGLSLPPTLLLRADRVIE